MTIRLYVSYNVIQLDLGDGISYEATVSWFDGDTIWCNSKLFASKEAGYNWIESIMKGWELT